MDSGGPGGHGDFVDPAYGTASLADLVPAIASALGIPEWPEPGLRLPTARGYVILLVDGLGHDLLLRHRQAAPFLSSLPAHIGTAGVPSTTATSLSSLGTALPPGGHGLVGYTSRVPETGLLLNHLAWDQLVEPQQWQPHETAFARLARNGVRVTCVNKRAYTTSGLTRAAHRGARYLAADGVEERLTAAVSATTDTDEPSLTYLYESDLDFTGHVHGVASTEWLRQLSDIDHEAERLRELLPAAVRMVVVADHGMVDSHGADRLDIDEHAQLRRDVVLLGGEARFRHVYTRPGTQDAVLTAWRETLGDRAEVLPRHEAVARGWFGPVTDLVAPRLGDIVAAARGTTVLLSSADFAQEQSLVGFHGSLTSAEMRIPVLVA